MTESLVGGAGAAPLSIRAIAVVASAVIRAVQQLFTDFERGGRIDATTLRNAFAAAFGASAANAVSSLEAAYDVSGAASAVIRAKAAIPVAMLPLLIRIASPRPAHGAFGEIISRKLRMFVMTNGSWVDVLAKVLDCYSIARRAEKAAA